MQNGRGIFLYSFFAAVIALVFKLSWLPAPLPEEADLAVFSAGRARDALPDELSTVHAANGNKSACTFLISSTFVKIGLLMEISRVLRHRGGLQNSLVSFNETLDLEICTVINLKGQRSGGREILLHAGNLWVAKAYAKAARGRGHATSIFQNTGPGIFFSIGDTDSAIQRFGELLLPLLDALDASVARGISTEEKDDEAIYFDILGSTVVVYGVKSTAFWLHTMMAELLVFIGMFIERPGIFKLLTMLLSLLVAAAGGAIFPLYSLAAKSSMFMPSHPAAVAGLIVAPAVAAWSFFYWKFLTSITSRSLFIHGRCIFGMFMTILTLCRSPASYLPMLWVAFPCAFSIFNWLVPGSFALAVALGYTIPVACTVQVFAALLEFPINWNPLRLGAALGFLVGVILLGCIDLFQGLNFHKVGRYAFAFFLASLFFEVFVRLNYDAYKSAN